MTFFVLQVEDCSFVLQVEDYSCESIEYLSDMDGCNIPSGWRLRQVVTAFPLPLSNFVLEVLEVQSL